MQTTKKKRERNDRLFAVPQKATFEADIADIRKLPRRAVKELEQFFAATDALDDDKNLEFLGWHGPSHAVKAINKHAR